MSASMRDWIGPLVETELNNSLTSFQEIYVPGQSLQEGCRACGPDTVTVNFKKGREVQLIEFNERTGYPLEAVVSDGTTHIRATFDQVAVDLFAKSNGRDFSTVRGAVIALLDYNITFNRKSKSATTTLVIEVSNFKFRGSEGSKTFGRPSDVFQNDQIRQVLVRLEDFLNGEGHENELRSQPPSPSGPRTLAGVDQFSSSGPASQEAFATQLPGRVQKESGCRADVEVPKARGVPALFNLLSKMNPAAKPTASSVVASSAPSSTSADTIPRKTILAPVSSGRMLEMTSKLEAKANEQSSQSSLSQERQANSSKSSSVPIGLWKPKDLPEPDSGDSEKENSQESFKARIPIPRGLKTETIEQATLEQESIQMSIIDQFQDKNPFLGLKRVPRKFVRIQQSQETFLEDKESWYKPPVDSRSTYANLPAKLRDDLITWSERPLALKTSTEGRRASEIDSEDSDDDGESQDKPSARQSEAEEEDGGLEMQQSSASTDEEEGHIQSPRSRPERQPRIGRSLHRSQENQKSVRHSDERQHTLFSPSKPDHPREEMANSCQSESDVTADEDIVSWASSPEQRPMAIEQTKKSHARPYASANRPAESSSNMCLDASAGTPFLESVEPSLGRHENDAKREDPKTTRRLWPPVTIPPSSPTEEKELEYAIPYAIGDFVEESDTEEGFSEIFQTHSSLAIRNEELVQVEQTPFQQLRYSGGRSLQTEQVDESLKETKRIEGLISSDPRIPATCEDPAPERSAPSSSEATSLHQGLDMPVLTVQYRYDGSQHASHLRAKINIKEEDEDDDLAQNPLSNENETSHIESAAFSIAQDVVSLDMVAELPRPHQERYCAMLIPSRNQGSPPNSAQQSSPLMTPRSTKNELNCSPPAMMALGKRSGDYLETRPHISTKRRRYVPPGVARMIKEEISPTRDGNDIVRTGRHNFKDNLPPATENASTLPSSSQGNSYPKEVIPSTNRPTTPRSSSSPEPAVQSSVRDGLLYVPATFDEPTSTPEPASLQNASSPMQSTEMDNYHHPDPASHNNVIDTSYVSDAEEDDAILRDTSLPITEHAAHSEIDFYEEFVHIYPAYLGSKNAFARALVNIEWIRENGLFLPWARYDDFIRILASDWLDYIEKNRGLGVKLMSGLRYYEMNFPDQPSFEQKFINGENLQDALASLDADQVAKYRAKYRDPLQKDVSPAQTPNLASDTVATRHMITKDLETGEETPIDGGREASPELGSMNGSVFDRHRKALGKEASPELGSKNRSSRTLNTRPKQPFFETHSQLPIAQRRVTTPRPRGSSLLEVEASETKSNSSRVLPWKKDDLTPSPHLSTPTASRHRGRLSSTGLPYTSSPSGQPRHLVRRADDAARSESLRPAKRVERHSSTPSSHDSAVLKRHSLPNSSFNSLTQPGISKHAANPERVTPRRPTLQDFLARRNRKSSTPKSTPGKRFCTKPARSPPRQLEPETQGWV